MSEHVVNGGYDGKPRRMYPKACEVCGVIFYAPRHRLKGRRACSLACKPKLQATAQTYSCHRCGVGFKRTDSKLPNSKSGLRFCGRACKDASQRIGGPIELEHYRQGVANYRKRALRHYGERCTRCQYNADVRMLDVDHRDGDRSNNRLENLDVLCVWCHALKTRGVEPHVRREGLSSGERFAEAN